MIQNKGQVVSSSLFNLIPNPNQTQPTLNPNHLQGWDQQQIKKGM